MNLRAKCLLQALKNQHKNGDLLKSCIQKSFRVSLVDDDGIFLGNVGNIIRMT